MKQKQVLFLSSWYPSKNNPNLGNFVQRHAEAANEHAQVTALFVTSSTHVEKLTVEKEVVNGVETFIAYYPKVKGKLPFLTVLKKFRRYLDASKYAFEIIGKNFDLVHLNITYPAGLFALWLKKKKQIPYVLTEQWTGYLSIKGDFKKLSSLQQAQHARIFKNAEMIFPVSDHLGKALVNHGLISTYKVLHNVVNHELFFPAEQEKSTFQFIHVSTFDDAHKNVSGMFRVFKRLYEAGELFEIQIVTEGDESVVFQLAEQLEIPTHSIKVDSSLDQLGVAEKMRNASCLVLFSNYETFSVVLAEAWMTGIPCVYSKCGGLTEIDNSAIGVQVGIKEENELFSALQKILRKEIRFNKDEITAFAKDFRKENVALRIKALYKEALNK